MIPTPPHLIRTPAELDRLFPWLRHELLRGIPHFISPSWTADRSRFDPEHYADCWQRIGFKSVTLLTVHHDGYYLYPSRLCRLQPDRDYFGEQVEACRRRGIRVIAYYSLTLNSLVGSEHPEWRVRDLRGRVHQPDYRQFSHYHWMCLNSPFRDFAVAQLEELVTRYPVEGIWLDILYLPGLPGPNDEPETATCFCDHCHRQYSAWNHGEHLVDAAHSARHLEFRAETYKNFLIQAKTMLLRQPKPLLLTFNGAGRYRMPFYERNDALADLLTGEAHSPMSLMIAGKVLRNDGRPFEMLSCSEVCWSHISPKPTTLIQLESLPPIIQGGTYTLGITHAPDGRLSPANIERLVEHSRWIHERRDVLTGTEPVYEAAIAGPYQKAENWALILRQAHVLFNILPSWKALGDYRVVVFPAETAVPADAVPLIEAYVRQGGAILVESPAARVRDGGPWTLQDLLGCTPLGEERAYGFYLDVTSRDVAQDLLAHEPIFIEFGRAACVGLTTAEPLAVLVPQFKDKVRTSDNQTVPNYPARPDQHAHWPGIVLNTLDQGRAVFSVLPLSLPHKHATRSPWPAMLGQNLVRFLLGQQTALVEGHTRIEILACRPPYRRGAPAGDKAGQVILHFLNHNYGAGDAIPGRGEREFYRDLPVQLSDALWQTTRRIRTAPEGRELEKAEQGQFRGFILPSLGVYQAVVLEQGT